MRQAKTCHSQLVVYQLLTHGMMPSLQVRYRLVEDEYDVGALIYREYQLRKAEAAAAAAASALGDAVSRENVEVQVAPKKKRRISSSSPTKKQVDGKKYKKVVCLADGCTNRAVQKGVCIRHGAEVKLCSKEGCASQAKKGGVCWRHFMQRENSRIGCNENEAAKEVVCVEKGVKVPPKRTRLTSNDEDVPPKRVAPNNRGQTQRGQDVPPPHKLPPPSPSCHNELQNVKKVHHKPPVDELSLNCAPMAQPIPSQFEGDMNKNKDASVPDFGNLANFPCYKSKKCSDVSVDTTRKCVMCGNSCPYNYKVLPGSNPLSSFQDRTKVSVLIAMSKCG